MSATCAEDPNCAADQVKAISNGFTNWNPWTTFKTGAYKQFLQSPADFAPPGSGPSQGGTATGIRTMSDQSNTPAWAQALGITDLGDLALRGGLFLFGGILIIVGIIMLFRVPQVVGSAASRAGGTLVTRAILA